MVLSHCVLACTPVSCVQVEVTKFDALEEAHAELKLKDLLWKAIDEWDNYLQDWTNVSSPFPVACTTHSTLATLIHIVTIEV